MPLLLAAPDKFRGTVTARQASEAMAAAASPRGWSAHQMPLSDGGDGLLEVLGGLGGESETLEVEGPLGTPVEARWIRLGNLAVVEMARASGLALAGGAEGNDAVLATSRGTGQLIAAAARSLRERPQPAAGRGETPVTVGPAGNGSAATVVVGLGGSATTDGGLGAVRAIEEGGGLAGVRLLGACDVDVGFVAAAKLFAPQKGASRAQVEELEARLVRQAERYADAYGVDVTAVSGAGAAGGFGGAIVALGGTLRSGYEVVAELLGFRRWLSRCQLVVTGEGALDTTSFAGKVVGSVLRDASVLSIPSMVVAGRATSEAVEEGERLGGAIVSLSDRFGQDRALSDTAACIEQAVAEFVGPDLEGP